MKEEEGKKHEKEYRENNKLNKIWRFVQKQNMKKEERENNLKV